MVLRPDEPGAAAGGRARQRLPRARRGARRPGGRDGRGSRHAAGPAPGAARAWPSAAAPSAATAHRGSCARWRPSTTAPTGEPRAGRRPDHRARPQRLRPARPQRQPVPLHRLPADPGRRLRARPPARRRRRCAARADRAARRGGHPPDGRERRLRAARPTSPGRSRCSPSTPTPCSSPARPTGASTSTCAVPGRRSSSPSTALPELRGARRVGDDVVEIGAALTLSEVERGLGGPGAPARPSCFPQFASRLIRNGATLGGNLATASPIGDAAPVLLALEAVARARVAGGRARGAARRLLHRLPAHRAASRRADPRRADPVAAQRGRRVPQDRQAALRRHLERGGRHRPRRARRRRGHGRGSGSAASPPPRCGRRATEAALEGRPWTPRPCASAARGACATEGTPIDDHRASAAYRSAMLGTALLRLHARTDAAERRCGA